MAICATLIIIALTSGLIQEPKTTADHVLQLASAYADRYAAALSTIVLEEKYIQDVVPTRPIVVTPGLASAFGPDVAKGVHREWRADVVIIGTGTILGWRSYRDVFIVDGKPVRDRDSRIQQLILTPSSTARVQAERIAEESSRFNISLLARTLNEPGLPIAFLRTQLRDRFRFSLEGSDRKLGANVVVVRFAETHQPTVFLHNNTLNNPSSGRLWIDTVSGEVVRTEHTVSPPGFNATFTTDFKRAPRVDVLVPDEMREVITEGADANAKKLVGKAMYSNLRHYEIDVNQRIK